MDAYQFDLPVRLVLQPGQPVIEIYSAEEALDLLMTWPVQDGPLYQRAMDSCVAAIAGTGTLDEARRAFTNVARVTKVLAKDVPLDSLYEGERLKQELGGEDAY
ncbi:DUF982 domain-containing protein [Nitratireductor thuwali]|uniref:DUF982 domain-containing protein n=1 Tax=Nitratireductor thuwali TaxID=2267699 RepID=A0ABY5MEM8_9HYPH|nr:hypothetical protein NTH_00937 [Nitratireductor thuwali]